MTMFRTVSPRPGIPELIKSELEVFLRSILHLDGVTDTVYQPARDGGLGLKDPRDIWHAAYLGARDTMFRLGDHAPWRWCLVDHALAPSPAWSLPCEGLDQSLRYKQTMFKMLEDVATRMTADVAQEREDRQQTEETLIRLLEQTCQSVETSLR
ncbi:IQ calmodulin-binding motif protein [Carpediemonas membranifera]|uniref:IQ calmodulin-binding motif protein n=1 Tax=Carpediemonas membranifera TaxID=201153 RepID=A0A8J6E828_9EUKA|nr:IQ calmodulin-binding motif protein [Carpediemonas membranifera]|eukprot:KAG9391345.1 IQ calmodulin-binding motif protein [Carpediemonas membranifera]